MRSTEDAGFTLLDLMFVVALIAMLCSLTIPGLVRARGAAQATSSLGTLRVINSAQLSFAITCGLGFYAPDLPTLGVRPAGAAEPFLAQEMTGAMTFIRSGYSFSLAGTAVPAAPATCNGVAAGRTASGYALVADPLDRNVGRFFGTNSDGVVYEDTASLSATMPEAGAPPVGHPIH